MEGEADIHDSYRRGREEAGEVPGQNKVSLLYHIQCTAILFILCTWFVVFRAIHYFVHMKLICLVEVF